MDFKASLRATRLVPVIVIKDLAHAVPLARALVSGGLNILEVTLRTLQRDPRANSLRGAMSPTTMCLP